MATMTIRWRGDEAERLVVKEANNRLSAAGRHLRDAVKRNISTPSYTNKAAFNKMRADGSKPPSLKKSGLLNKSGKSGAEVWNEFQQQTRGKFKGKSRKAAADAWAKYKKKHG